MVDGNTEHVLREVEALIKRQEFTRAIEILGEIDFRSISPSQSAWHSLLFAQASINLGNHEVGDKLSDAILYYKNSHDNGKYALAKLLHGMMLSAEGKLFEAKESLIESYATYRRLDDYGGQAAAMGRLSFIAHHCGDTEAAMSNLQKCIELYEQNQDQINVSSASMNLGLALRARGRLKESLSLFAEIERKTLQRGGPSICKYYLMLSIPYALLNDFDTAREMLEKAEPYLDEFIREKAIYYEYLGWIHNLEGDYDEALKALKQGLDVSLRIAPESALVSQTKRLMADAYVGLAEYDKARAFADEAMTVAEILNERVEKALCYRVYAQVEAAAGHTEASREWYDKAMNLFSMIGSQYELAATRYLAAISGFYLSGERHALLYLAREYFQSEDVVHYVEKINRELAETPRMRSRPTHSNNAVPIIICRDAGMKRLVDLAEHIAPSGMSVLLTGETGTGKDLFARYIHHLSGREGRFVSVNAAAIPNDMVESELFGYRRGAYTGASMTTSGWIEEAERGTFYLNEIADSSPELQAKLLDVIENRRVCRLGERQEREIDCRFIAATNHRLEQLIEDGRFRLDLFHRLNEIPIHIPPLSERLDDIELLLEYFLKAAGIDLSAKAGRSAFDRLASIFSSRPWPGNVRQMETEVKRLALICRGDLTRMADTASTYQLSTKEETLAALQRTGWNRREVGRILGISESTVRHRIKIYNLTPDDKK